MSHLLTSGSHLPAGLAWSLAPGPKGHSSSLCGSDLTSPPGSWGCAMMDLVQPLLLCLELVPPALCLLKENTHGVGVGASFQSPHINWALLSPRSPVFCLHSRCHSWCVGSPYIWRFARRTHRTYHIVVPMAKTYNSDRVRIHTWVIGEKTQVQSGGACM